MLVIGAVLGAALLLVAVRQVNWRDVAGAVSAVSPWWLMLAAGFAAGAQVLLAARWHVLVGSAHALAFGDAFDFVAIGALAGLVLPTRLSDVARAVAAGRYHATSATGLFGTIIVERVFDVLMLVVFGAAISALMDVPPALQGALTVLAAGVAAMVVLLWMGEAGPIGMAARWAGDLRGPRSRIHAVAERFLAGTGVIRERARVPKALGLTLAAWIGSCASASLILVAFGAPAPWFAGAFVVVIINLAGILPAPPAGLGVYDYAAMTAAGPWMGAASAAFAFALVMHAMSAAVVIVLGSGALARKGLSLGGLRRLAAGQPGERMP